MTKFCNPQPFEVKRCPDCNRAIPDPPEDGKKKCRKCLQYVEFVNGKAVRAIPKEFIEQ